MLFFGAVYNAGALADGLWRDSRCFEAKWELVPRVSLGNSSMHSCKNWRISMLRYFTISRIRFFSYLFIISCTNFVSQKHFAEYFLGIRYYNLLGFTPGNESSFNHHEIIRSIISCAPFDWRWFVFVATKKCSQLWCKIFLRFLAIIQNLSLLFILRDEALMIFFFNRKKCKRKLIDLIEKNNLLLHQSHFYLYTAPGRS